MCFFKLQGSLHSYVLSLDSRLERNLWLHFWLLGEVFREQCSIFHLWRLILADTSSLVDFSSSSSSAKIPSSSGRILSNCSASFAFHFSPVQLYSRTHSSQSMRRPLAGLLSRMLGGPLSFSCSTLYPARRTTFCGNLRQILRGSLVQQN